MLIDVTLYYRIPKFRVVQLRHWLVTCKCGPCILARDEEIQSQGTLCNENIWRQAVSQMLATCTWLFRSEDIFLRCQYSLNKQHCMPPTPALSK